MATFNSNSSLELFYIDAANKDQGRLALLMIRNVGTLGSNLTIQNIEVVDELGNPSQVYSIINPAVEFSDYIDAGLTSGDEVILFEDVDPSDNMVDEFAADSEVQDISTNFVQFDSAEYDGDYEDLLGLELTEASDTVLTHANHIILHSESSIPNAYINPQVMSLEKPLHAILIKYDPTNTLGDTSATLQFNSNSQADLIQIPLAGSSHTTLDSGFHNNNTFLAEGSEVNITPVLVGTTVDDLTLNYKIVSNGIPLESKILFGYPTVSNGSFSPSSGTMYSAATSVYTTLAASDSADYVFSDVNTSYINDSTTLTYYVDNNYYDAAEAAPSGDSQTLIVTKERYFTLYKHGAPSTTSDTALDFGNVEKLAHEDMVFSFMYRPGDIPMNIATLTSESFAISDSSGNGNEADFSIVGIGETDDPSGDYNLNHDAITRIYVKVRFNPERHSSSSIARSAVVTLSPSYSDSTLPVNNFTCAVSGNQTPINISLTIFGEGDTMNSAVGLDLPTNVDSSLFNATITNIASLEMRNNGDMDTTIAQIEVDAATALFYPATTTAIDQAQIDLTSLTNAHNVADAYLDTLTQGDPLYQAALEAEQTALNAKNQQITYLAGLQNDLTNGTGFSGLPSSTDYLLGDDWGLVIYKASDVAEGVSMGTIFNDFDGVTIPNKGHDNTAKVDFNIGFHALPNSYMPTIEGIYTFDLVLTDTNNNTTIKEITVTTTQLEPTLQVTDFDGTVQTSNTINFNTVAF